MRAPAWAGPRVDGRHPSRWYIPRVKGVPLAYPSWTVPREGWHTPVSRQPKGVYAFIADNPFLIPPRPFPPHLFVLRQLFLASPTFPLMPSWRRWNTEAPVAPTLKPSGFLRFPHYPLTLVPDRHILSVLLYRRLRNDVRHPMSATVDPPSFSEDLSPPTVPAITSRRGILPQPSEQKKTSRFCGMFYCRRAASWRSNRTRLSTTVVDP